MECKDFKFNDGDPEQIYQLIEEIAGMCEITLVIFQRVLSARCTLLSIIQISNGVQ
jgi:hypothetical protein